MQAAPLPTQQGTDSPSSGPPGPAVGKADAATPKLTENDEVELQTVLASSSSHLPVEDDIMRYARLGEVGAIQKLLDQGKVDATYKDDEGITPLHWAAINNQYAVCKYLIDKGADVNAKGGESVATPIMWAVQKCHYYVANLLLQNGADPLLLDHHGNNILHLASFDGNVFLLVLLLHQNIPIDLPGPGNRTGLMWVAFKGFPACVDLFLRSGADVHATDEDGFNALHWALVKGSYGCVQKLIEYGSDRFAETSTGKTPAVVAREMKSIRIWHRALADSGFDEDGHPISGGLLPSFWIKDKRLFLSRFLFLWPFLIIWSVTMILSHLFIVLAIPLAGVAWYACQWIATQSLKWAQSDMKHMHRTPFLAGIFAGSCFWVGVQWVTTILPYTFSSLPFSNLAFGVCYGLCSYFYSFSMLQDPGYVPKIGGLAQQKAMIEELLGDWIFDQQNFCVQCMIRRPLRSKHCKRCGRCVAKHDHHCPWIHNCVGINNHRHFLFYIISLEAGVILLVRLVLGYLELLPESDLKQCLILGETLCGILNKDPYTVVLTIFVAVQLTWVTMLITVQLVQIARAQTTYENMQGHLQHDTNDTAEAITSALTAGTTSLDGAQLTTSGAGPDPAVAAAATAAAGQTPGSAQGPAPRGSFVDRWKKLLGLDTFVATAQGGLGNTRSHRPRNPFSRGVLTNCRDYWCDPAPVFGRREPGTALLDGELVNYTRMYETPPRIKVPSRSAADAGGGVYRGIEGEQV
ncbi:MAG: palmitoyltransferase akr1 [Sclerophora amabilis]|nr:MAG: palmitoyltransferase akr1 [Sclerophora amabilis]